MPSLGFSVEHKAPAPRRAPSDLRRPRDGQGDGGFVACMIGLGLLLLAAGGWHGQALPALQRLLGV